MGILKKSSYPMSELFVLKYWKFEDEGSFVDILLEEEGYTLEQGHNEIRKAYFELCKDWRLQFSSDILGLSQTSTCFGSKLNEVYCDTLRSYLSSISNICSMHPYLSKLALFICAFPYSMEYF